jgi:hypothetical protein
LRAATRAAYHPRVSERDARASGHRLGRVEAGLRIVLTALAVLLALRAAAIAREAAGIPSPGFVTYYTASRLLLDGEPAARFHDRDWFSVRVRAHEPTVYDFFGPNPPPAAFLALPVAWLDYRTARTAWIAASLICFAALALYLARAAHLGPVALPAFMALALAFPPMLANLWNGQVYSLVLGMFILFWRAYRTWRDGVAGGTIALLGALKATGAWLIPLIVAQRRWRTLSWLVGIGAGIVLLFLPLSGVDAWRSFVAELVAVPREFGLSVTAYQTVYGFFHHLFDHDVRFNAHPLADAPALADALSAVALAALVGASMITAARTHRLDDSGTDLVFAAFTLLGLVATPVSDAHHYTIALLPIAILLGEVAARPSVARAAMLTTGIVAIAAPLPYTSPHFTAGARAFLAYPVLYGALLLWALALHLAWTLEPRRDKIRQASTGGAHG